MIHTISTIQEVAETTMRRGTRAVAAALHRISHGNIHPNDITIIVLLMHLPISILIATDHLLWAAGLLTMCSLADTLDGELARMQNKVTDVGGLLDAVSTRLKELLLYSGVLYLFSAVDLPVIFLLATMVACGSSLIIPFVNAKGEAIIATYGHELSYDKLSRMFATGLLPYGVRVSVIIVGLLAGVGILPWTMAIMAILVTFTMLQRLISIIRGMR